MQRHAHQCVHQQGRKEPVLDPKGEESSASWAGRFWTASLHTERYLSPVESECERLPALDPHFGSANQIKASAVDRGSMIRIPIGNEKSMRVEVRSVAPDANPYHGYALDLQDRN